MIPYSDRVYFPITTHTRHDDIVITISIADIANAGHINHIAVINNGTFDKKLTVSLYNAQGSLINEKIISYRQKNIHTLMDIIPRIDGLLNESLVYNLRNNNGYDNHTETDYLELDPDNIPGLSMADLIDDDLLVPEHQEE